MGTPYHLQIIDSKNNVIFNAIMNVNTHNIITSVYNVDDSEMKNMLYTTQMGKLSGLTYAYYTTNSYLKLNDNPMYKGYETSDYARITYTNVFDIQHNTLNSHGTLLMSMGDDIDNIYKGLFFKEHIYTPENIHYWISEEPLYNSHNKRELYVYDTNTGDTIRFSIISMITPFNNGFFKNKHVKVVVRVMIFYFVSSGLKSLIK